MKSIDIEKFIPEIKKHCENRYCKLYIDLEENVDTKFLEECGFEVIDKKDVVMAIERYSDGSVRTIDLYYKIGEKWLSLTLNMRKI